MKKILLMMLILISLSLIGCSGSNSDDRELKLFNSKLLAVKDDGRYGYVNKNGEVEIPFLYDQASAFYDGIAVVKVSHQMYIIDTNGEYINEEGQAEIYHDLDTGNFLFLNNSKWGMMDKRGKVLVEALYDKIYPFREGMARVKSGSKYGFIDKTGEVVVDIEYYDAANFYNGYAGVMNNNDEWGFIDKKGEVIIALRYDAVNTFDVFGNVIVVEEKLSSDEYFLINKGGTIIFDAADYIRFSGVFYAVKEGDEVKLYNPDESRFNDKIYDYFWYMTDYAANLEFKGVDLNILFDEKGKVIAQADYWDSDIFTRIIDGKRESVLVIYGDDKIEIYYRDNYFRFTADDLYSIVSNNEFIIERDDRFGIVDKDGKTIVQFLYDGLDYTNDGYYIFVVNGKYGVMNSKYETIISAEYERIVIEPNIVWIF